MLLSCTVSFEVVNLSVVISMIMISFTSASIHQTIKLWKNPVKLFWSYLAQTTSINFNDMKLLLRLLKKDI